MSYRNERTAVARLAAAVHAPLGSDDDPFADVAEQAGDSEERYMQAAEARADREQTVREETAKAEAKRAMESPDRPRTAHFTKLRKVEGQPWGVRVPLPSNDANPGCTVTVTTKAGEEKRVVLGSEVATFDDAALFTIGHEVREQRATMADGPGAGRGTPELRLPQPQGPQVPEGRYALDTTDGTNEVAFYHVDHGRAGTRWEGYTFVTLHTGGGDQRMSRAASHSILARIAEVGPEAAAKRYGLELGQCGVCGRELTNDDSRERGIGPKCAAKMGW